MADIPQIPGIVSYATYDHELDPAIAASWNAEGSHWRVWDWDFISRYLQVDSPGGNGNAKWFELHVDVPPPADNLMNETMLDHISDAWDMLGEGAPVRATMWYKASRIGPVPYMWHYVIFLEYHESPQIAIGALITLFVTILGIVVGLKMLGFNAGSVSQLVAAPFSGAVLVFMLGTAFLVALAYFQQQMSIRAPVRPTPPRIPQVAPTAPLEIAERTERVARGAVPRGRR